MLGLQRIRGRDERGQVGIFALLAIIGMLIPMMVAGWGLSQWLAVRSRVQAVADAAALAAAETATPYMNFKVSYEDQQCQEVPVKRPWGTVEQPLCRPGPTETTTIQEPAWDVGPGQTGWMQAVGCVAMAPYQGTGRVCLSAQPQGVSHWAYRDQGSSPYSPMAAEAAQYYIDQNMLPASIAGISTENGGAGQVEIIIKATVRDSPLALWHGGPVTVQAVAVADPRFSGTPS